MTGTPVQTPINLKPNELEAVYAISSIVAETVDIDMALDRITKIARRVFIFDNAVIYLQEESPDPEPFFARAIGRGKSSSQDLAWGDAAAKEAIQSGKLYLFEAELEKGKDRLDQPFVLGLPMLLGGKIIGALIFIRFGGPQYSTDQINLAQFITIHVTQLFEHKRLVEMVANLEAERRLTLLQDDFVAMVSHELKTPLGFIKGYTTTLLRQDTTWDAETQQEFLTIIDEETDRLSELIENLLDSYRLKSGTVDMSPKQIPLAPFFNSIVDRIRSQKINLDLTVEVTPSDLVVIADGKRLTQVIENLINNASKYAPNSTLSIRATSRASEVLIDISDTGPGIPDEHLEHIFKRFYRVPERSAGVRGTGLGLYIVKQIIDTHKGHITVDSNPKKGTTFHIVLPGEQPYTKEEFSDD